MNKLQWYYKPQTFLGEVKTIGPLSQKEFEQHVLNGKVEEEDRVINSVDTNGKWLKAGNVEYIRDLWANQKANNEQKYLRLACPICSTDLVVFEGNVGADIQCVHCKGKLAWKARELGVQAEEPNTNLTRELGVRAEEPNTNRHNPFVTTLLSLSGFGLSLLGCMPIGIVPVQLAFVVVGIWMMITAINRLDDVAFTLKPSLDSIVFYSVVGFLGLLSFKYSQLFSFVNSFLAIVVITGLCVFVGGLITWHAKSKRNRARRQKRSTRIQQSIRPQITGKACRDCNHSILFVSDGKVCPSCHQIVCMRCQPTLPCSKCNGF